MKPTKSVDKRTSHVTQRHQSKASRLREKRQQKTSQAKTRPRSKAPTYALTMVGKILYRRMQKNTIVSSGLNLVRQMSSTCSLLQWKDRLLSYASTSSTRPKSSVSCQTVPESLQSRSSLLSSISATCSKASGSTIVTESLQSCSDSLTPHRADSAINTNENARTRASAQDTSSTSDQHSGKQVKRLSQNTRNRRSRTALLVTKSKLSQRRYKNNTNVPAITKELSPKTKVTQLNNTRVEQDIIKTCPDAFLKDKRSNPNSSSKRKSEENKNGTIEDSRCGSKLNGLQKSHRQIADSEIENAKIKKRLNSTPKTNKAVRRGAVKWKQLIHLNNLSQSDTSRKPKRRRTETPVKKDQQESQTTTSDPKVDWPCLPGRAKTAKGIVMSKMCASVTKMTRRRWADIVSRESLPTSQQANTSWAEVVSRQPRYTSDETGSDDVAEDSRERQSFGQIGLSNTDRIWLTCTTADMGTSCLEQTKSGKTPGTRLASNIVVDPMTFIYTEQPATVLSLGGHASSDVNKCNNRGRAVGSGSDLCSQMSMMTFRGEETENKKKISHKYRALLRDNQSTLRSRRGSVHHIYEHYDATQTGRLGNVRTDRTMARKDGTSIRKSDKHTSGGTLKKQPHGRNDRHAPNRIERNPSGKPERQLSCRSQRQNNGRNDKVNEMRLNKQSPLQRCKLKRDITRSAKSQTQKPSVTPEALTPESDKKNQTTKMRRPGTRTVNKPTEISCTGTSTKHKRGSSTTDTFPVPGPANTGDEASKSSSVESARIIWRQDRNNSMVTRSQSKCTPMLAHKDCFVDKTDNNLTSVQVDGFHPNIPALDVEWWNTYLSQRSDTAFSDVKCMPTPREKKEDF